MRKNGLNFRVLLPVLAVVFLAGALAVLVAGGNGPAKARAEQLDAAGILKPARSAPPLALRNYLGQPVNIASYRGKAVLVTFLYTHCPDVCPLIASDLGIALKEMGPKLANKVQIIAVSVDPKGDTPKAVAAFLAHHEVSGRMQYLIGSAKELLPVWEAWGVGSERDAQQPELINHTGIVFGVTGTGKRLAVYPPEFKPTEIAHDVPLLAAQ